MQTEIEEMLPPKLTKNPILGFTENQCYGQDRANVFAVICNTDCNENEPNIKRATVYAADALSELPLSSRCLNFLR